MRAVIQRVRAASVSIEEKLISDIAQGLLVLIGIEEADTVEDTQWIARKICGMRIFSDENNNMNLSIKEVDGDILLVSQFTLHASIKKGNRPSFIKAAKPDLAIPIYEDMIGLLEDEIGRAIQTGRFGAMMEVSLVNDGPVTIMIDSKRKE